MKLNSILIVDDDEDDSEFFTGIVQEINPRVKVTEVSNRGDLFSFLKNKIPDVIFMDSFINQHSGQESIRTIRSTPELKDIPIVMYTGSSDLNSIRTAFEAGASSYVVKPHSLTEIREVMGTVLKEGWIEKAMARKQYYSNGEFHDFKA